MDRRWKAHEGWANIRVEDARGLSVCTVYGLNEEGRRNASLIVAAQDLLEALKGLCDYSRKPTQSDWQAADAAIAKAEGRP